MSSFGIQDKPTLEVGSGVGENDNQLSPGRLGEQTRCYVDEGLATCSFVINGAERNRPS